MSDDRHGDPDPGADCDHRGWSLGRNQVDVFGWRMIRHLYHEYGPPPLTSIINRGIGYTQTPSDDDCIPIRSMRRRFIRQEMPWEDVYHSLRDPYIQRLRKQRRAKRIQQIESAREIDQKLIALRRTHLKIHREADELNRAYLEMYEYYKRNGWLP